MLEVGKRVVGLGVRLGLVETNADGYDALERSLEFRVPFDRLGHRVVVQLVRQDDSTSRVEVAGRRVVDELLVEVVDIGVSNAADAVLPVVRVEAPDDSLKTKSVGDSTDAIVNVTVPIITAKFESPSSQEEMTYGGRQQVGVTPVTSLIACMV